MPLTEQEIGDAISRNDELKTIRAMHESLWREITEFIFPRRLGPAWGYSQGSKQTTKQYDSTAEHALNLLAATMHGTLTPTASIWSSFKLRDERLNHIKEVMDWLELAARVLSVARHQSNYASEMHEGYLDLGGFGEACIFIEEKMLKVPGFNGFQYKSLSNMEYCTAENAEGFVDTLFREFELTARAAFKKFGKNLGERIQKEAEGRTKDTKFTFIHATFPSDEMTNPKGLKPWVGFYIALDDKKLVAETGYEEFPYIVPRWSKTSGEDYGRGPGHTALPDTKTLNKAKEFGLKAWAKDLDPPTFEKDGGVIGSLKLVPGGRNIARDKESIWVMDHKIRYDVSQIKEEALRQSIREIFYSDQLKLPDKSDMREMEIAVRYELMQRILGPSLGRFESEALNKQIEREVGLMMRANSGRYRSFPSPPPILARMGIRELDIEYEGPLAKAQRYAESARIQRVFTFAGGIQPVFPDVFDNFDGDKAVRRVAEVEGAPSEIMRSDQERDAIREQKRIAREAEQKKQDLERLAVGVGRAAPALEAITSAVGEAKKPPAEAKA